jgi:hypothetical protein
MMSGDAAAGGGRVITAVIALYALVLQVFLATLMPLPAAGHADPICSGLMDGGSSAQGPEEPSHGHHKLCCTSVAAIAGADQPGLASSTVVWPVASVTRLTWRDEARQGARGPPGSIRHPRGPPAV